MSRGSLPPMEDDFSRALLGSAEADAPSHAAYAKVATSLGVGLGFGVGASLPAAAAVSAAGVAGVARWSSSLVGKLLLLGVSGALMVGAGALLLPSVPPSKPLPQAGTARASQALPAAAAPALVASAKPADDHARALKSLTPSPIAPLASRAAASSNSSSPGTKSAAPGSASVALQPLPALPQTRRSANASHGFSKSTLAEHGSSKSSLAEQVQSLDRARVALASGDSISALAEITRYRAAWPTGVFLTEASVLEIEALAARGERSLARARAADFVAAHPDSPQADRLRALIPSKKR